MLTAAPKDILDPASVQIRHIRAYFKKHHADHIRSKGGITNAFDHIIKYMKTVAEDKTREPTVADFGLARQRGFMRHARDNLGLSCKSISTYLSYYKAGLKFCATPLLLKNDSGEEKEVRLLSEVPHVDDNEDRISKETGLPRSEPRDFIPTIPQMARFLDAIEHEHVFRYALMEINTWARPEAVFELNAKVQVDFERRIIRLNPPGRRQTNKVRPIIPLTDNLRGWLVTWNLSFPIVDEHGERQMSVDNRTLQKAAKRAGIDLWEKFTTYTFRHFMSNTVRKIDGVPVSREERGKWLGHKDKKNRTTEDWYEAFDPEFLEQPKRATDAILKQLGMLCRVRNPIPPVEHRASGLMVVEGGEKSHLDAPKEEKA